MLKLFKYLRESKWSVLFIVLLLVVQAYCDLSLPTYTSEIVDIGIQQGGIAYAVPMRVRAETMDGLSAYLTADQRAVLTHAYTMAEDGTYTLISKKRDALAELEALLVKPILAYSTVSSLNGQRGSDVPIEAFNGLDFLAQMEVPSDEVAAQRALLFVKDEYTALGMDLGKVQTDYLITTGIKMLGLSLLMVATAIMAGLLASRAAAKIGMTLRGHVFKRVVSFSSAEIDKFSTASLITRSTNDIQQVQMVLVMLLRIVLYAPILGVGGVLKVLSTNTDMGWIIGVAVGSVIALVAVLMFLALPRFKVMQNLIDKLNLVSREILTGIPVIRAFSRERHEEKRFDLANLDLMKTQLFTNRCMSFMMPMMMLIMNSVSILIVWNGAHGVDIGSMQVGDMIAFITYTMQIVMAFLMISMISIMLPRAGVAATRINEVLDTTPTIHDKGKVLDSQRSDWKGQICFEDVSFRYPDAGADVLEHISFTAEPGKTTAIIGSTGSGKSTLLNLIPRFFDVSYGKITLDGIDIRDLSQHGLRDLLGYVPQKGILFSGDIKSNLTFGGSHITEEDMRQAAEIAQASDFIAAKDEGYASPISQGGTNVSGGQKQRLSIARAIAKHPKVYLFDDSFSALDYKTDVVLRRALKENTADATVIIVAQRISTILHAEQIVVLNEGKIVGIGNHESLMQTCLTYQEIARSQLSESELGGTGA